jgi:adenosylcobyric acid synthase
MLQGTASHVGKTVLVAGLCRLLSRRGLRVVPFKSQNMSLNAHVTPDGREMGWAQVMQAEAAGIEPRVEMNPILLKPRADSVSQVVVLGRVWRDVPARRYYGLRTRLWPHVVSSYRKLAATADVILIEGAGSVAEPNLMARDLANMRVARMARAPVLIVGDIDRGGVFASLVGTMTLLSRGDRHRVSGFIINKFRGDPSLLTSALEDLRRRTRKKVLGVVPMLPDLHLPEEDSVALDDRGRAARPARDGQGLTVAVIRLRHIANFTDFAPLGTDPGVHLLYAEHPQDLGEADLVILPGSKDTLADLGFIRTRGFAAAIRAHQARGGAVLGICAGYQMLGRVVEDPWGVESGGSAPGLGLLPVKTTLGRRKVTRRVRARFLAGGPPFDAYEIHMGVTTASARARALLEVDGRREGTASVSGRIWGTSLHGLFEAASTRRLVLDWARGRSSRSRTPRSGGSHREEREAAYDRLADALGDALDVAALDRLLRL